MKKILTVLFLFSFTAPLYAQTIAIAGTVKDGSGNAIIGVVTNGLPGNPSTDNSGNYGAYVSSGWSGTVTPSKSNYTFSPTSRTYSNVTSSKGSQNFTGSLPTYSIAGTIKDGSGNAIVGVVMSGLPGNPTTDNSGNYGAYLTMGWSGTITPTKSGYSFSPTSKSYSSISTNYPGQNYTATQLPIAIAGTIKDGSGNAIVGVVMSGLPGNPTTDNSGNYGTSSITYGWNGTVTPTKTGYSFTPSSKSYTNVTTSYPHNDYTAALSQLTIAGLVTDVSTGNPISGVVMNGFPNPPTTDANGAYVAYVTYGWGGTVSPIKSGWTFPSQPFTNVTTNYQANWTGSKILVAIAGSVKDGNGNGVAGVTMSGLPGSVITDASGNYGTTSIPYGWNGTITPIKTSYGFTPPSITYSNVQTAMSGQNYIEGIPCIIVTVDGLDFSNFAIPIEYVPPQTASYLADALNTMGLSLAQNDLLPFLWNRDARSTDQHVINLRSFLRSAYARATNEQKKLIVISHSWGTFLSYLALSFESTVQNPIICHLFITLSTPLGTYFAHQPPINWEEVPINGYVNEWLVALNFSSCDNCYPRVDRWVNYWAWGDLISGPVSDYNLFSINTQVDPNTNNDNFDFRNFSTTYNWHWFTSMQPGGTINNQSMKNLVKQEINNVINPPLPVELINYSCATTAQHGVMLRWNTATEINNYGFEIEQRIIETPPNTESNWMSVGFVKGAGTSNSPHEYSFVVQKLIGGRYAYRLKQVDNGGKFKYSQEVEVEILFPKILSLSQNYPNPFNPTTTIEFTVPQDGHALLTIYNSLGQQVAKAFDGETSAGYLHKVIFDASRLSSGLYYSRLQYGSTYLTKKIVLLK